MRFVAFVCGSLAIVAQRAHFGLALGRGHDSDAIAGGDGGSDVRVERRLRGKGAARAAVPVRLPIRVIGDIVTFEDEGNGSWHAANVSGDPADSTASVVLLETAVRQSTREVSTEGQTMGTGAAHETMHPRWNVQPVFITALCTVLLFAAWFCAYVCFTCLQDQAESFFGGAKPLASWGLLDIGASSAVFAGPFLSDSQQATQSALTELVDMPEVQAQSQDAPKRDEPELAVDFREQFLKLCAAAGEIEVRSKLWPWRSS